MGAGVSKSVIHSTRRLTSWLAAADRFLEAIEDLASRYPTGTAVVVSHGGVTTDALRSLLGDAELSARAPTLIRNGVPCGARTILESNGNGWSVAVDSPDSFVVSSTCAAHDEENDAAVITDRGRRLAVA